MINWLNDYCDRNIEKAVWNPCPTQEKRPRFFYYETESTYVGIAISLAYVVAALIMYTIGMSDAELLLIPALLTNLPHLFRRFLEYVPLLFRQVFYNWAYLIFNLTLVWIFPKFEPKSSKIDIFEGILLFALVYIHPVLSRIIYSNFKGLCLRHWFGSLKLLLHILVNALLMLINTFLCLWLGWRVFSIIQPDLPHNGRLFFYARLFISGFCGLAVVDTLLVHLFILCEL